MTGREAGPRPLYCSSRLGHAHRPRLTRPPPRSAPARPEPSRRLGGGAERGAAAAPQFRRAERVGRVASRLVSSRRRAAWRCCATTAAAASASTPTPTPTVSSGARRESGSRGPRASAEGPVPSRPVPSMGPGAAPPAGPAAGSGSGPGRGAGLVHLSVNQAVCLPVHPSVVPSPA